ncbi:MAG: SGNH/GDSL hydrolase family protein [Chloroflexus sp.]|uniref:SGNH/GDSL hydrolase family protein n=1 Tax=Chloroflexus sp. TaxID=1904827 RepID=UPI003D126539
MSLPPIYRIILIGIAVLLGLGAASSTLQPPAVAQVLNRGLHVQTGPDGQIDVVMPYRFALTFSAHGISAWRDLRRDPAGNHNLVVSDSVLVQVQTSANQPITTTPMLMHSSPVRAQITYTTGPTTVTYEVWAGGQIAISVNGQATISGPHLTPNTSSGAFLQPVAITPSSQHWLLFLDAWAGEALPKTTTAPSLAGIASTSGVGLAANGAVAITPSNGIVRYPRLRVRNWTGGAPSIQRAGVTLTPGIDYVTEYDEATGDLIIQYLHLLPPGSTSTRTFTIRPAQSEPVLALTILDANGTPRPIDPVTGMLIIDADLPAASSPAPGPLTTKDVFQIPYIQTDPVLRLQATVTDPPSGFDGVRFTVNGPGFTQTIDDTTAGDGWQATITLPRRAEYTVTATILVNGTTGSLSRTIAPVGYGRVFISIGDSITAGKWGFYRVPPGSALTGASDGYPFTSPPVSGSGYPRSSDGRNYPQADNTQVDSTGYTNIYYAGYQIELNNLLTTCLNSPVFILNDGFSGIRTARDLYGNTTGSDRIGIAGYLNVLGKAAVYRQHIADLGAEQILLQVGTNDATATSTTNIYNNLMPASVYKEDLRAVINALRQDRPDLALWVARLPWRNDGTASQATIRRTTTQAFNSSIVALVDELDDTTPIRLGPDFYSYFDAHQDQIITTNPSNGSADNIHPTTAGFGAMATLWANVLCTDLPPEPDPSPTPTNTPSLTPTSTATASPTATPTATATVTATATPTVAATATATPTATPTPGGAPSTQATIYIPLVNR